ncbi:hypothetical protein PGTDC60_0150 [Porphyromonas gingivalis TDC60]|nr:hypothetical protein PGTDC60_0150 [Porphyromonas gingivalis TDC60]
MGVERMSFEGKRQPKKVFNNEGELGIILNKQLKVWGKRGEKYEKTDFYCSECTLWKTA